MSSEIRITLTIFITLVFGVLSSALVNSVTEENSVNWLKVFFYIEFYILILLGFAVIMLSRLTAKESSEQWSFIKEKLEAMQSQGVIVSSSEGSLQSAEIDSSNMQFQSHTRTLEFTSEAKREIEIQEAKLKNKIVSFLYWLQTASVPEIVMNPDVRKVHGGKPTDFVLRIEDFRISVSADLQEGKIVVQKLLKRT